MADFNLQIFVPTAPRNASAAVAATAICDAEGVFCELGGGVTVTRAEGVWIDPSGAALRDPIAIVETDAAGDAPKLGAALDSLARHIGRTLREACIYVRIRPAGNARLISVTY